LAHDDPRKLKLPILQIAPAGEYTPPTSYTPDGKIRWRAHNVARLPMAYLAKKLCVPLQAFGAFRSRVAAMADKVFIDSTRINSKNQLIWDFAPNSQLNIFLVSDPK